MKKILLMLALSTMVFATSCKKEDSIKPISMNDPSCSVQCIDSADLQIFVVDYDTLKQSDLTGNVISINTNTDTFSTDAVFYTISRSQGIVLDSAELEVITFNEPTVLIDANGVYNFTSAPLLYSPANLKYDKNNRTTVEIWGIDSTVHVLLATVDLSHTGLYNPLPMNYIPNTLGITSNGGHANVDVSLSTNNWYNRVCVRF